LYINPRLRLFCIWKWKWIRAHLLQA